MLTKADFQQAIADSVAGYPAIAPLYQAGDPRITQHLDAMATMLAMFSAQLETAMAEPFEKTRDATVLADAAMRGIVAKASPARVRIQAENKGVASFLVETGRTVFDSAGLPYRIETAATVAAGGTGTFEAVQLRTVQVLHTVAGTEPFYAIEIPAADDDTFLCGVSVSDADGEFTHAERYVNIAAGERVFHIEADDRQRTYVRFGFDGFVGIQPADGSVITLTILYSAGKVNPDFGSPFSFEYIGSPAEASIDLTMSALVAPGENPLEMSVLRDLARYPSVYDHNAVYLGEFDFLVRSNFPTLQFLSVWNESAEERARGPNIESINTLFVACLSAAGTESVLTEDNPAAPVAPETILEAALTGTQTAIRRTMLAADDSYKVRFVTPVRSKIAMTINARVSTSYVSSDVQAKIVEALLAEFGAAAAASRRGRSRPLYQRVYELLRAKVAALTGGGADLTVSIADVESLVVRPEMWRYVAADSLTVTVSTANIVTPGWGR
ncbi:hypothetical protein BH10PSE16_BH10PSE16_00690 [soil metagenome]